ncbi:hypothetical protein DUNSADRAFT_2087 [Dunaliella salina]|nr:hypothetical protein DUNSADRAFT_2087 [Dunaliella salina]|eukprot:KAF5838830.1 hypothetical protein DUNSADRAFT_2087 [Dunaliella salina]
MLCDSRHHLGKHTYTQQQQQWQQEGELGDVHPLPPSLAWADAVKAMADASLYVILDCRHVTHVDATGARTFGSLNSSLGARGVRLLFAGLSPKASAMRKLLAAHGVLLRTGPEVVVADLGTAAAAAAFHLEQQRQQTGGGWCWEFRSLAAAEAHVERSYLATALARGLLPAPAPCVGLQEVLSTHAEELPMAPSEVASLVFSLMPYFHTKRLMSGEVLMQAGENVEELMLIEQGFLQLHLGPSSSTGSASSPAAAAAAAAAASSAAAAPTAGASASVDAESEQHLQGAQQQQQQRQQQEPKGFGHPALVSDAGSSSKEVHVRTSQYGPGCFVAAHEFFLRRPAASTAVAVTIPTTTTPAVSFTSDPCLNHSQQQHPIQTTESAAPACHAGARSGGRLQGAGGAGILSEDEEEEADKVESAIRSGAGCTVLCLSRSAFEAALRDAPGALSLLQWAALRSVCLDLTAALDLMERNSTL